jgi:hypothetical protein
MIEKKGASAPIYTTQGGHMVPTDKNILSKLIEEAAKEMADAIIENLDLEAIETLSEDLTEILSVILPLVITQIYNNLPLCLKVEGHGKTKKK